MIQTALVVDDSKSARFMLCKMLERNGLDVDSSESAEEALEYLADNTPDVIFMDHMMPGMDGLQATRTIKQDPRWAAIPVVLFTSKEGEHYRRTAAEHGAEDVLPKPPTAERVKELLDQLSEKAAFVPPVVEAGGSLNEEAVRSMIGEMIDAAFESRLSQQLEALVEARLDAVSATLQEQHRRTEEGITDTLMSVIDERMHEAGNNIIAQSGDSIGPTIDERLHHFEAEILAKAEERITPVVEVSARLGTENAIESASAAQRADMQAAIERSVEGVSGRMEQYRDELAKTIQGLGSRLDSVAPRTGANDELEDKILTIASDVVERSFERHGHALSTAAQRDAGAIAGQMLQRHEAKLVEQVTASIAEGQRRSAGTARLYAMMAAVVGIAAGVGATFLL